MEANVEAMASECKQPVEIEVAKDVKVEGEPYIKTKSAKEDRQKKKDVKSVEHVLKALSSLNTAEEKLAAMCKKYTEIVDDNRKLQQSVKHSDKRCTVLSKEKELLQLEYNRSVLLKSKLENLCRELQKQNKSVKDESLLKIREEEERRKETQTKFQTTLSEISALMRQNNEKNTELRDANIDITKKFKSVVEQYELREQQIEKMAKQMALESQLADAKLAKAGLEAQAEREKIIAENKQLLVEIAQYQAKLTEMLGTETGLRSQINMYTDKYDEFQNALTKSSEVFGGFKDEMEKMSKKIMKLEKENLSWKKRWESSHVALLDTVAEKQKTDGQTALLGRQLAQLQKLCRTMQAERSGLIKTLDDNNIPRPSLPQLSMECIPDIQPPQPNTIDKVDAMAMNCAQLKQSLAQLQGQLEGLTSKHNNEEDNSSDPKKGKNKRNKSKKNKEKRESPPSTSANQAAVHVVDGPQASELEINETEVHTKDDSSENVIQKSSPEEILLSNTLEINVDVQSLVSHNGIVELDSSNLQKSISDMEPTQPNLVEINGDLSSILNPEGSCTRLSQALDIEESKCECISTPSPIPDQNTKASEPTLHSTAKAVAVAIADVGNAVANALTPDEKPQPELEHLTEQLVPSAPLS